MQKKSVLCFFISYLMVIIYKQIVFGAIIPSYREIPSGHLKPIAKFKIEVYDETDNLINTITSSSSTIEKLDTYVGQKLRFTDLSTSRAGYSIDLIDFQYQSAQEEYVSKISSSEFNSKEIILTEACEWDFYVCARDSAPVIINNIQNWSENGTHCTLGEPRKYLPEGVWWYFTQVRVNVHPAPKPPLLAVGADLTKVKTGQEYNIIDRSRAYPPATCITQWSVREEYRPNSGTSYSTLRKYDLLDSSGLFFKSYKKSLPGEYRYTVTRAVDDRGLATAGTSSVIVKVYEDTSKKPPALGIDAYPTTVEVNELYNVIDYCIPQTPETYITGWEVREEFIPREGSEAEVIQNTVITDPEQFFRQYSKNQPGTYIYTVISATASNGCISKDSDSIAVTVLPGSVSTPAATPTSTPLQTPSLTPTPTKLPTPTPAPLNQSPVAIILAPENVRAGEIFYVNGSSSYDPDGIISEFTWNLPGSSSCVEGKSGTVLYPNEGCYSIHLTVTDDDGDVDSKVKTITVKPAIPTASIKFAGTLKENRKIILDGSDSTSIEGSQISSYSWDIIPVSGGTTGDIKYSCSLTGVSKNVLFKSPGTYRITLTVGNNLGYENSVSQILTILEDTPPLADFTTVNSVLRDPGDNNYASIVLSDLSDSIDGDIISKRIWSYRYDSDNDGDFWDETRIVTDNGNSINTTVRVNQVGRYLFELEAYEDFGQDTIPEFINSEDYRFDTTSDKLRDQKIVEVINTAPVTDFQTSKLKMVDVFVLTDYVGSYSTDVSAYLNNLKSDLLSQGIDAQCHLYDGNNMEQIGTHTTYYYGYKVVKLWETGDDYETDENNADYRLTDDGRILMNLYEDYDDDDYYERFSYVVDGIDNAVDLVTYGRQWGYRFAVFSTTSGEYLQVKSRFNSSREEFDYQVFENTQIHHVLDRINGPDYRVWQRSGGTLYSNLDTNEFYEFLVNPDGDVTEYVLHDNLNIVSAWYGTGDYEGAAFFRNTAGQLGAVLADGYYEKHTTAYLPQPVYGVNISAMQSAARPGSDRFCIFLSNEYNGGSDYPFGNITESLSCWFNNENFTVYASVKENILDYKLTNPRYIDHPIQDIDLQYMIDNNISGGVYEPGDLQYVFNDIRARCMSIPDDIDTYIPVNEAVEYNYLYDDYENDPACEIKWKYVHDPYYFENSKGLDNDSGILLDSPKTVFKKPGKYDVTVRARDNPKNDYRFDNYRKWSNDKRCTRTIYVHRRPVADFSTYVYYSGGYRSGITEDSYDLDHISRSDRGILEKQWQYKQGADGTWENGLPDTLDYFTYTYIKLTVKDLEGFWSRPKVIAVRGRMKDDKPPSVSIEPQMRDWDNTDVNVNILCSGNFDYAEYVCSLSTNMPAEGWTRSDISSFEVLCSGEGQWYIHVKAYYGGACSYKLAGPYSIDKTAPGGSYTLDESEWTNNSVTISFFGIDELSGVKRIKNPDGIWINESCCIYTALSNNIYTFEVEDNAGNQSVLQIPVDNIDKNIPSGSFLPDSSGWTGNSVNVRITVSDTGGSGVCCFKYRISSDNGTSWEEWSPYIFDTDYNITLDNEGINKIQAEVRDNAGNTVLIVSDDYKIDKTCPEGDFSPQVDWTNSDVHVVFNTSDMGGSGVHRFRYRLSCDNGVSYDNWANYIYGSTSYVINIEDTGIWKVEAEVCDIAGNEVTISSDSYYVDKIVPSMMFSPDSHTWTQDDITVSCIPMDEGGSGVEKWRYRISDNNGQSWSDWSMYIPENSSRDIIFDSTGIWRIMAEIHDNAGNSVFADSDAFYIDKIRPDFISTEVTGQRYTDGINYWIRPDDILKVKIRGYEKDSGMRNSYIRIPEGDNRAVHSWDSDPEHLNEWLASDYTKITAARETYQSNGCYEVQWSVKGLSDTLSSIQYYFRDQAGNNRGYESTGCSMGVDGTPPDKPQINTSQNGWLNTNASFTVSGGNDTGSGVMKTQYKIDSNDWKDYISEVEIQDEGEHIIYARTIDNVGYASDITSKVVKVDKTPPAITITPESCSITDFAIPVDITVEDTGGSGFSHLHYLWDTSCVRPGEDEEYTQVTSPECTTVLMEGGTWYLHVEAWDNAENSEYKCCGPYNMILPEVDIYFAVINNENPSFATVPAGGGLSIVAETDMQKGAVIESNVEVTSAGLYFNNEKIGDLVLNQPVMENGTYIYNADVFEYDIPSEIPDGLYDVTVRAFTDQGFNKNESEKVCILTKADLDIFIENTAEQMIYTEESSVQTELGIFNSILSQYSDNIFTAATSPYVSEISLELFDSEDNLYHTEYLSDDDKDNIWEWTSNITESFFEGILSGKVMFTAVTTNGNTESREMTYFIRRLKLDNLRISLICDYNWQNYFHYENGMPTDLGISGIATEDMPVFRNKEHQGIKLGYMTEFKIDSVGLHREEDTIGIDVSFYALDNMNYIHEADVYVMDESGSYVPVENSGYSALSKHLVLHSDYRGEYEEDPDKPNYNTWEFGIFVPASSKVVKKGETPDLYSDNTMKYKMLVVLDITGYSSTGAAYDYTCKEENWGSDIGSEYGANRPSNSDLLGKGLNHGEVFWYNLFETALDDLEFNREW